MWNGDMRLWEVVHTAKGCEDDFLVIASSLKEARYLCKAHDKLPPLKDLKFKELLITPTVIHGCTFEYDECYLEHDLAYEPDETKEATG